MLLLLPTIFIQGVNCVESALTTVKSLGLWLASEKRDPFWLYCCYSTPYNLLIEATSIRSLHLQPGPPKYPEPQRPPHFHGSALHSAATPDNTTMIRLQSQSQHSEVTDTCNNAAYMPLHGTSGVNVVKQRLCYKTASLFLALCKKTTQVVTLCQWLPVSRASRK